MTILNTESLAVTIDNLNDAFFYGKQIPPKEKAEVAMWIASRQGLQRSYARMMAPMEIDFESRVKLFLGDTVTTNAGKSHILGEESCRALILLNVNRVGVEKALQMATEGMIRRLIADRTKGTYCCGTCTVSYWRHLAVGGLENQAKELKAGMANLKAHRDGKSRWRRYPFYYTLLALSEIDLPSVKAELKYAAPVMERAMKRPAGDVYSQRRQDLIERIFEKI
jgi:hypothetical protein